MEKSRRLEIFLNNELLPYDLHYTYKFDTVKDYFIVTIFNKVLDKEFKLYFRIGGFENTSLKILINEESFHWKEVNNLDRTVKYFWIKLAPKIF